MSGECVCVCVCVCMCLCVCVCVCVSVCVCVCVRSNVLPPELIKFMKTVRISPQKPATTENQKKGFVQTVLVYLQLVRQALTVVVGDRNELFQKTAVGIMGSANCMTPPP